MAENDEQAKNGSVFAVASPFSSLFKGSVTLLPQFLEQFKQDVEIRQRILQVTHCYL